MPGFERNRFVGLSDSLAKHLKCSICLNIFDNAVNNKCGHTFCKGCLQQWIQSNRKECPECREAFTTKRSAPTRADNSVVIISNYVFMPNLMANAIVTELSIKCEYEFNGCQEVIEVSQLPVHLKKCQFTSCKSCGFTINKEGEHNCLELMKNDRNELKAKVEHLENKFKEWKEKAMKLDSDLQKVRSSTANGSSFSQENKELRRKLELNEQKLREYEERLNQFGGSSGPEVDDPRLRERSLEWKMKAKKIEVDHKDLKERYTKLEETQTKNEDIITRFSQQLESIILDTNYVQFGGDLIYSYKFNVNSNEFKLFITPSECLIAIRFEEIQELMYCSDPLLPVLIIKPKVESLNQIRNRINNKDPSITWFNSNQNDTNEKLVIIVLYPECIQIIKLSLMFHSLRGKPVPNYQNTDVVRIKQFLANTGQSMMQLIG